MPYDRADHDYSTEDEPLPKGHAATHIGMFLAWAVLNGLESDFHWRYSKDHLAALRRREITGREFFEAACNGRVLGRGFKAGGKSFAGQYYSDDTGKSGGYFAHYK